MTQIRKYLHSFIVDPFVTVYDLIVKFFKSHILMYSLLYESAIKYKNIYVSISRKMKVNRNN